MRSEWEPNEFLNAYHNEEARPEPPTLIYDELKDAIQRLRPFINEEVERRKALVENATRKAEFQNCGVLIVETETEFTAEPSRSVPAKTVYYVRPDGVVRRD